jgi:hypothetical protein
MIDSPLIGRHLLHSPRSKKGRQTDICILRRLVSCRPLHYAACSRRAFFLWHPRTRLVYVRGREYTKKSTRVCNNRYQNVYYKKSYNKISRDVNYPAQSFLITRYSIYRTHRFTRKPMYSNTNVPSHITVCRVLRGFSTRAHTRRYSLKIITTRLDRVRAAGISV